MLSNVFFLVILKFKKGIIDIDLIFIDILFQLMSHSLNLNLTLHLLIILISMISYTYL